MLTALILLTTALYIEVVFADVLSGPLQWAVGGVAAIGIAVQCKMAWHSDSQAQSATTPSQARR